MDEYIVHDEVKFFPVFENENIKIYLNEEDDFCLGTDAEGKVLFRMVAGCSQNAGYMTLDKADEL